MFISINAALKGKMCGLCGFNDGDKTNDFKTSQGATTTNMATFGSSWKESSTGGKYIYRIHPETVKSVILENVCKGGNDLQDFMIYSSIITLVITCFDFH